MAAPTKEELLDYLAKMKRFNEWEEKNPPPQLTPQNALAAISGLYRLMPEETRRDPEDPTHEGLRRTYEKLSRRRRR